MPDDLAAETAVTEKEALRRIVGEPLAVVANQEMPALDKYARRFIEMSPFLVLGTAGADGHIDMSPRGDPPGFVRIVDDRTLVIPDRRGNQRVDSMTNLTENPSVGLIFFLPGVEETLRIRGRATITRDARLLAGMEVNGKAPRLGLLVAVEVVFFQCAKALIRSKLWHPETRIARSAFPSYGRIVRDQRFPAADVEQIEGNLEEAYRDRLY